MKKYLLSILISMSVMFSFMPMVLAEDSKPAVWLQLSPVSQKISLNPGDEKDYTLTVENIGSEKIHFRVYVTPYNVSGENYDLNFTEETARTQISRWITFEQTEYDLEVGQKQAITYHISVPADVPDGGQYATIFAESASEADQSIDTNGIKTVSRIGMVIYSSIGGDTREGMSIEDFSLPVLYFSGKITGSSTVKNAGNTDFEAKYFFTVKSFFGDTLYDRSETHQILPETDRKVEMIWEDTPALGIFNVMHRVEIPSDAKTATHLVVIVPPFLLISIFLIIALATIWIIIKVKRASELKSRLANKAPAKE